MDSLTEAKHYRWHRGGWLWYVVEQTTAAVASVRPGLAGSLAGNLRMALAIRCHHQGRA